MATGLILIVFLIGYALIALEHKTQINKSAIALFLSVSLWVIFMLNAEQYVLSYDATPFKEFLNANSEASRLPLNEQIRQFIIDQQLLNHVGEIAEIILFLMGAMTIVELIDRHGGFNFVNNRIKTRKRVYLLWITSILTFFLSAVLDNMTTAIVMIMVLRKLIGNPKDRWIFASMIILAANAGGVFSPIGDVTTIMLWINGNITPLKTILHLFLPSIASILVPLLILTPRMKGNVAAGETKEETHLYTDITHKERIIIFSIGVGGLISVPIFEALTGLPPFIGIFGVLALLWLYTEIMYDQRTDIDESNKYRVSRVIQHIDMSTILFFFGILMAVAVLQESNILSQFASILDQNLHNVYWIDGLIGALSSVVDNVPLVAGAMGMYPLTDPSMLQTLPDPVYMSHFLIDGPFWQLLAYCAGVGGSMLIIGSAAGVVVMGLEKINFGWYLKHISFLALIGYLSGIGVYYLQSLLF